MLEQRGHPLDARRDLVAAEPRMRSGNSRFLRAVMCGIERVVLEHHRDVALLRREVVHDAVADADRRRRSRVSSPATSRSTVDLPQPDGPTSTTSSPSATRSETSATARVPSG